MTQKSILLIVCLFLVFSVGSALATTLTFPLKAGEEIVKPLNLEDDDRVIIEAIALGTTENLIDFLLSGPDHQPVAWLTGQSRVNCVFICNHTGEYTMHFSNVGYSEDKQITLNYNAEHYLFGMPQMLFLTCVIAIICVLMVAVFILSHRSL